MFWVVLALRWHTCRLVFRVTLAMSTASGAGAAAGTLGASRSGPLGGSGAAMGGAGGPATGTVGRTGTLHLSSTVAPKVATAAKTMVRGGTVVATPFATSATPFVRTYPSSIAFGLHDTVLNPPNRERASHARSTHSKKAVTVQSAGTVHKVRDNGAAPKTAARC